MWEKIEAPELSPELANVTTSVYSFAVVGGGVCYMGVMRPSLLSPPVLWFTHSLTAFPIRYLRMIRPAMEYFQRLLNEPLIYCEVSACDKIAQRFALHAGFREINTLPDRVQYERSL